MSKSLIEAIETLGEIVARESTRTVCGEDMKDDCVNCQDYFYCNKWREFNEALVRAKREQELTIQILSRKAK